MKWKNIKIRNKLAISFGLLVFLMSVIIYNSLSSINNIVSNAKNVESADHIKLLFTERYADHLKWANKVSFALQNTNETSVNVETNPHNCAFGKWFYGTGRQEAESFVPEIKPVLDSMEEIHNKLHSTAEEINTFLSRGDRVGALNVFNTKTTVYLHEIGLKFHSINGIISQNNEKTDQSYQADVKAEKTGLV
ncbi:MAG TPA: CZB domain-containing protein, partial [Bacteroidales bacterium]